LAERGAYAGGVTPERARRLLPVAAAAAGVVLAHAADYAVVYPDAGRRSQELSATGHGYWPVAVGLAAALGAVAVVVAAVRGARRRAAAVPSVARLAALQMIVFAVIEVVERVSVGVDPVPFLHSPSFAVGLVLQVAAAAGCAFVLAVVERAARRIAGLFDRAPRRPRAQSWTLPVTDRLPGAILFAPAAPRGPPLAARS
jgi:hypothetical protein